VNVSDLPVVRQVLDSGARDRVYDSLVLAGLPVIVVIVVAGRSALTTGLAALYLALFVSYLAYQGVTGGDD
jgi:hypothetical protein